MYLDTSMKTNPTFGSFANKELRRQATAGVDSVYMNDKDRLYEKFYYLDHTAEVLENYRKIQENLIFDRVLHDQRQKKAFLKSESRKLENLLEGHSSDASGRLSIGSSSGNLEAIGPGVSEHSSAAFTIADFLKTSKRLKEI